VTREGPGAAIGRYKLLRELGEGGFGVVYEAEQTEPVRRNVALKVIKPGMDTRQVIARFEVERQALALMDHPGIAKVLDAGATESGRPYFVMELVKGIPITEFCDRGRLDTAERLALFRQVCHAVQHAHQKGIIHRDLKPGNVLVALHDNEPVPKVIDFGIAKATDRHLTERTLFTEFRQMIGTPEYMAPEQAELSGLDVDTRADIYSLGVLLYEILSGAKPHDLRALAEKAYDEMLRTIREVDPQRPSARASTLDEAAASNRRTTPNALGRVLRGDLDWVVLRALEKDRSRRYATADAMALDIERYLNDQPVAARQPSALYRARKYVRRHRVGVIVTASVAAALLAGVVSSFAGYVEADRRRDRARVLLEAAGRDREAAHQAHVRETEQRALAEARERESRSEADKALTVLGLVQDMLSSADPRTVRGRNYTVRQLLDDFGRDFDTRPKEDPEVEAELRATIGLAYLGVGLPESAEAHVEAALETRRAAHGEESTAFAESLALSARLLHDRRAYAGAEQRLRRVLEIRRGLPGEPPSGIADALEALSECLGHLERREEAAAAAREAVAIRRAGGERSDLAASLANLAAVLLATGDHAGAEAICNECLAIREQAGPADDWRRYVAMSLLGEALAGQRRRGEAEPLLVEGYERMEPPKGAERHRRAALDRVIRLYEAWGKPEEAARYRSLRPADSPGR